MSDKFPGWRYGPDGQSAIFECEADIPKGWEEHPSLVEGFEPPSEGVKTAGAPANSTTTAEEAALSTEAKSQTMTDPAKAAASGTPGITPAPPTRAAPTPASNAELDADGHAYDPALHAATKSKTKAGLWRMKVGVARPAPAPGYPLDL
jgi:hypothetical protein